jgi:hypothetical protein
LRSFGIFTSTVPARVSQAPGPVPVAAVHTVVAALVRAGAAELVDIQRHEAVGDEPEHLGQQLGVGRLRQKRAQGRGL